MRSWNGLPCRLSTVMYCLSSSTSPAPATSLCSATGRAGKFHDAPPDPVGQKPENGLDWSGLFETAVPRMNIWHDRYALPLVSQATDVSPPACQYCRATSPNVSPRAKPIGGVESVP